MRLFVSHAGSSVLIALLVSASWNPSYLPAQVHPEYTAVVGPNEALFSFPIPEKSEWAWNDSATPAGRLEYRWDVTITDSGRRYRAGYLLAKYPGSSPARGDLRALLDAGQRSFFVLDGTRGVADPGVNIEVIPGGNRLWIRLRDPDAIAKAFSGRPAFLISRSLIPGQAADSQRVPVVYVDGAVPEGLHAATVTDSVRADLGRPAPDFSLPLFVPTEGETGASVERLSTLRGEVVVLYFWSGTCPVSRREYPDLVNFAERWAGQGVRFRGVILADTAAAGEFLREQGGARFPHLVASAEAVRDYGSPGSPFIVVIDRQGRVTHAAFGAGQLGPEMILPRRLERLTEQGSQRRAW